MTAEVTVSEMDALPVRPSASVIVAGRLLAPGVVAGSTVARNVNMLSPAVASPFVPSSKKDCVLEPPMAVRSPTTSIPVLGGPVPGVTATVSVVSSPTATIEGLAAPTPEGGVVEAWTSSEMLQVPVRASSSVIVAGMIFVPAVVPEGTAAR